jgi:hypothetical protein
MAGLVANTSMTPDDVLELTIEQIEGILDGFRRNNSTEETSDRLEDAEALKFLISNGGKI